MKKLLLCLFLTSQLMGQILPREAPIVQAEYFFGNDPGIGNGIAVNFNGGLSMIDFNLYNISVPANNFIFVRVKNSHGKWSAPRSVKFIGYGVQRNAMIDKGEYFINNDPGVSKGQSLSLSVDSKIKLTVSNHEFSKSDILYIRIKDSQGRISPPYSFKLSKRNINSAEIFIGAKPGAGNFSSGLQMKSFDGNFDSGFEKIYLNNQIWNKSDTIWIRVQNSDFLISDLIGTNQITTDIQEDGKPDIEMPSSYSLSQNFPNPFNPATTIKFSIPRETLRTASLQHVTLIVYDMLGKEVATLVNEEKQAGYYEVKFEGSKLASGVYFYRLTAGSFNETKKFILLK